jgi:hypothetical protein
MRLIVFHPFFKVGCLLKDLILLSTIASIRILLLFRPALSWVGAEKEVIVDWLEGADATATGVILRGLFGNDFSPTLSLVFVLGAALLGAAFFCLRLSFVGRSLHPLGLIEGHVLLNLHAGFILHSYIKEA